MEKQHFIPPVDLIGDDAIHERNVIEPLNLIGNVNNNGAGDKNAITDDMFAEDTDDIIRLVQQPTIDPFASEEACFDEERESQDFEAQLKVQHALGSIEVRRRPSSECWFRSNQALCRKVLLLELKEPRSETYFVSKHLKHALQHDLKESTCRTRMIKGCMTSDGEFFFWVLRLETDDSWARSAMDAATRSEAAWVRMQTDMKKKQYTSSFVQPEDFPFVKELVWPKETFRELLRIAFLERTITTLEHSVIQRLNPAKRSLF